MKPYEEIMTYFGYRNQMKKLNEECYEFLEAIDNYEDMLLRKNEYDDRELSLARDFVVEEMGDVLLLVTQFIAKYNITQSELDGYMDIKLFRTLDRIEEGFYKEKE